MLPNVPPCFYSCYDIFQLCRTPPPPCPTVLLVMFQILSTSHVGMTHGAGASCVSMITPHATRAPTRTTYSRGRKVEAPCSIFTVTWVSAAHTTCPGPVSTVPRLASVDKDKPQPSLTWQSSGLCGSLIWHSCLTPNGVFLLTWQPFSQCYDHKLFMLCGTTGDLHIYDRSGSASLTSLAIRNVRIAYWRASPVLNQCEQGCTTAGILGPALWMQLTGFVACGTTPLIACQCTYLSVS